MFGLFAKRIYLDYASATPVLPEVIEVMRVAERLVGNPGAIHSDGVEAKKTLERARAIIAGELACKSREIIFTSGLTEANNLAILGVARKLDFAMRIEKSHWIVSSIEHDAVLQSFSEIERLGGIVDHIAPNEKGIITPEAVLKFLKPETVMVSIGWANNEIGVIQPLRDISRAIKEKYPNILLHTDAGQAPLYIAPHVHTLGVDLFCIGSNKLYGPHGSGAIYISNVAEAASIMHGGKQERGLRPGTENVALAAGFALAVQSTGRERESERARLKKMRDEFARELLSYVPDAVVNGDLDRTLPHMLNISVPNVKSEYVALVMSDKGVAISTKSACREGEESRSHVVYALGDAKSSVAFAKEGRSENTFRISLGRETRESDLEKAAKVFKTAVELSRSQQKNRVHRILNEKRAKTLKDDACYLW